MKDCQVSATVDAVKPQRKRTTMEHLEKEREMWTAGLRFSWRKKEMAAHDRAIWRQVGVIHWKGQGISRHSCAFNKNK